MAKTAYKPAQMLQEDPLAALKRMTEDRSRIEGEREADRISAEAPQEPPTAVTELRSKSAEDLNTDVRPVEVSRAARSYSVAPTKPLARQVNPARSTFYLYPEDLTKLRMLSGYASTHHGIRANDSLIMRAALSLVESDVRFMHALEEAMQADRRKTKS